MYTPNTKDLIKPATLHELCDAYAATVEAVDGALQTIAAAHARMSRLVQRFTMMPQRLYDFDLQDDARAARAEARKLMQQSTWHEILRLTGVPDVMTQAKRDELRRAIDDGKVPPVNYASVMALLSGLRGDVGKIVAEAIAEASRLLRPRHTEYKTNGDGWQLGRRAILSSGVEWRFGSFGVDYYRDAHVQAIDNAFHLLDGKGVPAYPDRLADKLRAAMSRGEQACRTDYFACKWFKNGSLHFEFLRDDLVAELNSRTADHRSLRSTA